MSDQGTKGQPPYDAVATVKNSPQLTTTGGRQSNLSHAGGNSGGRGYPDKGNIPISGSPAKPETPQALQPVPTASGIESPKTRKKQHIQQPLMPGQAQPVAVGFDPSQQQFGVPTAQIPVRTASAPPGEPHEQQHPRMYQYMKTTAFVNAQGPSAAFMYPQQGAPLPGQYVGAQNMPAPHYNAGRGGRGTGGQGRMRGNVRGPHQQYMSRGIPQHGMGQHYYPYMAPLGAQHPGMPPHSSYIPGQIPFSVPPAPTTQRPPTVRESKAFDIIDPRTGQPIKECQKPPKEDITVGSPSTSSTPPHTTPAGKPLDANVHEFSPSYKAVAESKPSPKAGITHNVKKAEQMNGTPGVINTSDESSPLKAIPTVIGAPIVEEPIGLMFGTVPVATVDEIITSKISSPQHSAKASGIPKVSVPITSNPKGNQINLDKKTLTMPTCPDETEQHFNFGELEAPEKIPPSPVKKPMSADSSKTPTSPIKANGPTSPVKPSIISPSKKALESPAKSAIGAPGIKSMGSPSKKAPISPVPVTNTVKDQGSPSIKKLPAPSSPIVKKTPVSAHKPAPSSPITKTVTEPVSNESVPNGDSDMSKHALVEFDEEAVENATSGNEDDEGESWEDTADSITAKVKKSLPTSAISKPKLNTAPRSDTGKITYSIEDLLRFKDLFTELPESSDNATMWLNMEIITEGSGGSSRSGGSRGGGSRGGAGSSSGWERGVQQASSTRSAMTARSTGGAPAAQWGRSEQVPRRGGGGGDRRNRGARSGPGRGMGRNDQIPFDGPVKPLEVTDNRWVPRKATTELENAQKKVQSIMNKMTKENFDKLANKLGSMRLESHETLDGVIRLMFDKALAEPHFCDMYANLCIVLQEKWKVLPFLRDVYNYDDKQWYWTAQTERDEDVIGPFDQMGSILESCTLEDLNPVNAPENLMLSELIIHSGMFLKIWRAEGTGGKLYWSGQRQDAESLNQQIHGPFNTKDQALVHAAKQNSFKRILLNKCQEEFEKENIYEELNQEEEDLKNDETIENRALLLAEISEKKGKMKRRMLGNIRFIGELFKKQMLQEKIMHECVMKLINMKLSDSLTLQPIHPGQSPDEENLESLCKLLTTIGKKMDVASDFKDVFQLYFDHLEKLSNDQRLCSRIRFMIKDVRELRQNNWEPRRKELKQRTLDEIRKEAAKERAQAPRVGGAGSFPNASSHHNTGRRNPPPPGMAMSNARNSSNPNRVIPQVQSQPFGGGQDRGLNRGRNIQSRGTSQDARGSYHDEPSSSRDPSVHDHSIKGRPVSTFGKKAAQAADRGDREDRGRIGMRGGNAGGRGTFNTPAPVPQEMDQDKVKVKIVMLIKEYQSLRDIKEAIACYQELPAKYAKDLMISISINQGIECKDDQRRPLVELMEGFIGNGFFTGYDVEVAMAQSTEMIDDLLMDIPKARQNMGFVLGWLMPIANGVALDGYISLCHKFEEPVNPEHLATIIGTAVQVAKQRDLIHTRKILEQMKTNISSFSCSSSHAYKNVRDWIVKYSVEDVFCLSEAFKMAEMMEKKEKSNTVLNWVKANASDGLRTSRLFIKYAFLFILELGKDSSGLPHSSFANLLRYICEKSTIDDQVTCLDGAEQAISTDKILKMFQYLSHEKIISKDAFLTWKRDGSNVIPVRQQTIAQVSDFLSGLEQIGSRKDA